jgi:exopolyphosphatase/guanosine-5'-triphosphate,3'-diphosphate pyrophosphatase
VAVIDMGSNSTRLLVARVEDGRVEALARESRVTRLGRGVDTAGQLAAEAIEATCAVVADYRARCEELDVDEVVAFATSAVRDASNGDAFLAELRERFALGARVLEGSEEARLTYLGAISARGPANGTLVIDIGGGSTELILGSGPDVRAFDSLQVGVVRHSERHLRSDPPAPRELEALAEDVRRALGTALAGWDREVVEGVTRGAIAAGIAVAGTATSLAAIDLELDPYDPDAVEGHRLARETIQRHCSRLSAMPLLERRQVTGLDPDRAPTIVAGVVTLIQVMRAFGLDEVEVSDHDLLEGAALRAAGAR